MSEPAKSAADAPLLTADTRALMIGLMCVLMLAALETTIVGPALPTIGRDLGDLELMPWIVTAYLIVSTALTPLYGKLADIRGRSVVLLTAVGMFLIGSLACALAPSMGLLALARAVQGIGGGGVFAMVQTIIGDVVPPEKRARFQVYTSTVWVLANVLGPALGGWFADHFNWSLIFWINLPLGAAALAVVAPRLAKLPRYEKPHALDVVGSLLLMVATVLMLLTLTWGGVKMPWASPQILGLAGGSAVFWALFALRQASAREPLIPLTVLGNPVVLTATMTSFFAVGFYLGLSIYLPIYFQTISGLSVSASGFATIPLLVFTSLGATIGAQGMHRMRRYKLAPQVGLALASAGCMALAALSGRASLWTVLFWTGVVSTGVGTIFPLTAVSLQAAVPKHEMGSTMALLVFLRSLGGAIGVASLGALLMGIAGAGAIDGAGRHGTGMASVSDLDALARAFMWMFFTTGVAFAIAFGTLCAMRPGELRGYGGKAKADAREAG